MIDPPSGRAPEQVSRWAHDGTETCGGGKTVSGGSLGFLGLIRIYRPENNARGPGRWSQAIRARPPPWARPVVCWPLLASLDVPLWPINPNISQKPWRASRNTFSVIASLCSAMCPSGAMFRCLAEGGIDHGGPLQQPCCPHDDV